MRRVVATLGRGARPGPSCSGWPSQACGNQVVAARSRKGARLRSADRAEFLCGIEGGLAWGLALSCGRVPGPYLGQALAGGRSANPSTRYPVNHYLTLHYYHTLVAGTRRALHIGSAPVKRHPLLVPWDFTDVRPRPSSPRRDVLLALNSSRRRPPAASQKCCGKWEAAQVPMQSCQARPRPARTSALATVRFVY